MSRQTTSELVKLRRAWNRTPEVHRFALLIEVPAKSTPHYWMLRGEPNTALPLEISKQMEAAAHLVIRV